MTDAINLDVFCRKASTVAYIRKLLVAFEAYYNPEIRGFHHLPKHGPFLIVGNHSGGAESVDYWGFLAHWIDHRGPEAPLYSLTYDLLFAVPKLGTMLRECGFVPASHENASHALQLGAPVAVFPGGDYEVFRPWRDRTRIDFGGRTGFISLALRERVPIVPMTIHGTHESTFVLTRGRRIAHWSGLDRMRVKVFPLIFSIPFGITPAFVPTLQMPSKITIEIGKPIRWMHHPASDADDEEVLRTCYEEITATMQATMDRLVAERPWPILTRLGELRPDRLVMRSVSRWWGGK